LRDTRLVFQTGYSSGINVKENFKHSVWLRNITHFLSITKLEGISPLWCPQFQSLFLCNLFFGGSYLCIPGCRLGESVISDGSFIDWDIKHLNLEEYLILSWSKRSRRPLCDLDTVNLQRERGRSLDSKSFTSRSQFVLAKWKLYSSLPGFC
jgi:hypothetical protein